ncbi:MAG: Gfo/Idh/MocA family oxidoreductase [Acidobacteria bacterium]|nr:Gfo/Idh/MocA family oxidoreductase [Acidobacteriota bacterium]
MTDQRVPRRKFMSQTSRAAAAAAVLGPGPLLKAFTQGSAADTVRIGVIGFGVQGLNDATAALRVPNVKVVAAASCYDGHLDRARELLGEGPLLTRDYRRILDDTSIDAVIVSTPDHWHSRICLDAIAAGKDVYCEKPLTHRLEEGDALVKAVRASKQIFQVGSQHTSSPSIIEAKQLIADGVLGQVTQVKASWDTNSDISAWVKPIPPNASEKTVDWARFQGLAPKRPFDPRRVFRWRTYREYGEGLAGDVLVHIITAVHFMLNLQAPTVGTAVGGRLRWKDDRNVYDTITGGWEYPEGVVTVLGATQNNNYDGTGIRIMGSKATMVMTFGTYTVYEENDESNWRYTTNVWPKALREEFWAGKGLQVNPDPLAAPPVRAPRKVLHQFEAPPAGDQRRRSPHMEHFVGCVRSRKQPVQDVSMGNDAAIAAHLANLAYFNKKTMRYDRASRKLLTPVETTAAHE